MPPTPTRRQALAAVTGAAVAGPAAAAGRPAGLIDCQSHLYPPFLLDLLEKRAADPRVVRKDGRRLVVQGPWVRTVLPGHSDPAAKLAAMDAAGVATAALSINDPGPELLGADGPAVARDAHDWLAQVCRDHPGRFFGLATLPLQNVPAALAEFDRCVTKLGFRGVLLYSNLGGRFPDEAEFRPLFAAAEAADLPVLLHPPLPSMAGVLAGYELISGLGNMFDTTIALTRLIYAGVLDRHPKLKLVCPHLGGTLPYLIGRIDHQNTVLNRGPRLRRKPSEYLRDVYLDAVSPLPAAVRLAHEVVGPDRLLFASDHPWVAPSLIVDTVTAAGLPAESEAKLFRENARRLFRL